MIPLMMLSVAIAAGNRFILKPSEQDPGRTASRWPLHVRRSGAARIAAISSRVR
jgi:acyl-CoA reductase-like NAD-dependent aldehyde dehydrogenase